MKVEILIYAYLAICTAMIGFNIVCAFWFMRSDRELIRHSVNFTNRVREQIEAGHTDEAHLKYLSKKLKKVNNLIAFDKTLEELYIEEPQKTQKYIEQIASVFEELTFEYQKRGTMQLAFFPYIIKKYNVFKGSSTKETNEMLLKLVYHESLYCRENALRAIYSTGDCSSVIRALVIIDNNNISHNGKLITDGLLEFTGDSEELANLLWEKFPSFSERMRVTLLGYFRFKSGEYCPQILDLLKDEECPKEIAYSCIRYFEKYYYAPSYDYLIKFADMDDKTNWEYAAIAASALSNYPGEKTVEKLKEMLHSSNWYVRYNASGSLDALGVEYEDLIRIFEGSDRYAGEIMRYRLDQKRMKEKAVGKV